MRRMRAEQMMRLARADSWAEDHRAPADPRARRRLRGRAAGVVGRSHRRPAGRAAAQRPGRAVRARRPAADVRAEARADYIDSVRSDLEISSTEDKLTGELNIAWVHLGVEGSAGIVEQADGTYRVDLALDGEIGANLGSKGAKGHAGIGAGVAQSYEFDSQAEAEAFVAGLYEKLMPDVDLSVFAGPGGLMADTVDDVVGYLGEHSDQRRASRPSCAWRARSTSARRVRGQRQWRGRCAVRLRHHETTLFVGGAASGASNPDAGRRHDGSAELSADLEVELVYDDDGNVSELDLGGTFGGEGSVGIEAFLNGTNADSATAGDAEPVRRRRGGRPLRRQARPAGPDRPAAGRRRPQQHGQRWCLDVRPAGPPAGVRGAGPGRRRRTARRTSWDIGIASLEIEQSRERQRLHVGQAARRRLHPRRGGELREDRERCLSPSPTA